MKTMLKRMSVSVLMFALALGTLTGCGGMKAEDAKAYVQATLDAGYKAEFKEYVEITKSKEADAQKFYDENLDLTMSASGIEEMGVSDEMIAKYKELFKVVLSKAKYTVGDVKETDGGFEVSVNAEPMMVFDGLQEKLIDKLQKKVMSSTEELSEDDINKLAFELLYDMLNEKIEEPSYGEAQTMTVHVEKDSDGVWNIPESDLQALDSALFYNPVQ